MAVMVRRSPWLDERTTLLAGILASKHGIATTDALLDAIRDDISDHLNFVAQRMRIQRRSAKMYITDEVIDDLANRIATTVRRRQAKGAAHLRVIE
ncbi:hypothetical protein B6K05_023590 [Mycobacterium avium subsp. hominissuis]|nr:hypothetical protein B6K05_023590 [Mycobacterium avium subsp. hominissuis]